MKKGILLIIIIIFAILTSLFIIQNNKTNIKAKEDIEEQIHIPSIGDYVKFNPEEGHTYESKKEYNGSATYKFTSKNIKWRILKLSSDDNGIILISENPIKDDNYRNMGFAGKQGYWNIEQELNHICSIYGYGNGIKEARSITGEDINSIINYDKTKEYDGTDSKYGKSYFLFDNGTFLNEDGTEEIASEDNLIEPKLTTYSYLADDYIDTNSKEFEVLFKDKYYWLATKGVGACSVWAYFNILSVNNEFVAPCTVFSSYNEELKFESGVRPIIIMKDNIKIDENSGDGYQDNPYKLIIE